MKCNNYDYRKKTFFVHEMKYMKMLIALGLYETVYILFYPHPDLPKSKE